jgi:hypothetical protein
VGEPLFGSGLVTVLGPSGKPYTMPKVLADRFPSLRQVTLRDRSSAATSENVEDLRPVLPQRHGDPPQVQLTRLPPDEERAFQAWAQDPNRRGQIPTDASASTDYDFRGFWRAQRSGDPRAVLAIDPSTDRAHFPDTWTTPSHPEFSDESIYSHGRGEAPHWYDDRLIRPDGSLVADYTETGDNRHVYPPDFGRNRWAAGTNPTTPQLADRATHPYETALSPDEERLFQQWISRPGVTADQSGESAYDWRGAWKAWRSGDPNARALSLDPDGSVQPPQWDTPYVQEAAGPDRVQFGDGNADVGGSPQLSRAFQLPVGYPTERGTTELRIGTPQPQPTGQGRTRIEIGAQRDRWLPGARPTPSQAIDRATHPYETRLTPEAERRFQQWVADNDIPFDPGPKADYDMRGFWIASQSGDPRATTAVNRTDGQVHFPDTWKTPHHETFSDESEYAQPGAPAWRNNLLLAPNGRVVADERPPIAPPVVGPRTPQREVDEKLQRYRSEEEARARETSGIIESAKKEALKGRIEDASRRRARSFANPPRTASPLRQQPSPASVYQSYVDGGSFGADSGGE